MKPSHFLYKSDGLYYMQNVPDENQFYRLTENNPVIDEHTVFDHEEYEEALERAKTEAVKVDDEKLEDIIWNKIDDMGESIEQGKIYTINMEEEIEIIEEPELPGFDHTSYPTFKKVARIRRKPL